MYNTLPPDIDDAMETFIFAEDTAPLNDEVIIYEDSDDAVPNNAVNTISYYYDGNKEKPKKGKKKKDKKNKKYDMIPGYYGPPRVQPEDVFDIFERQLFQQQPAIRECYNAPDSMLFDPRRESAFFFGKSWSGFVGKHQDRDGHISVFGGSGSGKSSCIAIPTIATWKGPIFAIDFKGELVARAARRKPKVLNLLKGQRNFYRYDPFYFLLQDGDETIIQNARELAQAIIPLPQIIDNPFWLMSARDILTGAFVYYCKLGTGFIEAILIIKTTPIAELLKTISSSKEAQVCVNPDLEMDTKMIAGVSAELHNHISVFATDTLIQDVLSPPEDITGGLVKWEDLEHGDVFLRIDHRRASQWGSVIRLMLTQLIRTLESRPEKYSSEGANLPSTLLMLDEFPQYGKIDVVPSALQTLRSKNVTIALFCQSLADLDAIYGVDTRRVILDNSPYRIVLNASDAETQQYFSNLVGTAKFPIRGVSVNYNKFGQAAGYNRNVDEVREPIILPHEFAALQDIVILHPGPERFCRVERVSCYARNSSLNQLRAPIAPPKLLETNIREE